jgi:hypothetical protein
VRPSDLVTLFAYEFDTPEVGRSFYDETYRNTHAKLRIFEGNVIAEKK